MAAPVATFVQLPLDTGNTGKKMRVQSRIIGADTVLEHAFTPTNPHSILGVHFYHSGIQTVPIAAHNGTTTGFTWLINPIGSTAKGCIRGISVKATAILTSTADLLPARQLFSRCTFTGTASGATIAGAKRTNGDAAPQLSLRTASTGLTVTLGNAYRGEIAPLVAGTTGAGVIPTQISPEREFDNDERLELLAGEGIVCWSADASTTANKRFIFDLIVEEFE